MGVVLDAARSCGDDDLTMRRVTSGPNKKRPAGPWLLDQM